ncbi:MAG: ATP-NAD kinase family protein [Candidatus Methanofastidiosia archaeon]|jgi:predicted polyphosphate/ATP-dependent NAD kinase
MMGLIVNPVAGLGGPVGLKGTDNMVEKALQKGGTPVSEDKAVRMLSRLPDTVTVYTCGGSMGEKAAKKADISYKVVYTPCEPTTREDTMKAAKILKKKVDLLLFCGGDGTAQDIFISSPSIPVLGIPAGVKMYSSCFAVNPESAAETAQSFLDGSVTVVSCEILDIDEELYRQGVLSVRLHGYLTVPHNTQVQSSKQVIPDGEYQKRAIGAFITELIRDDTMYILGAGTTVKAIGDCLRIDKTLLGVDVIKGKTLIKKDCSEKDLLSVCKKEEKVKIIVSLIGGQGFIFGRGNQQISPAVIQSVGLDNIIVVATPEKLMATPVLHVDTGDCAMDNTLKGEHLVVCGYQIAVRKQVV